MLLGRIQLYWLDIVIIKPMFGKTVTFSDAPTIKSFGHTRTRKLSYLVLFIQKLSEGRGLYLNPVYLYENIDNNLSLPKPLFYKPLGDRNSKKKIRIYLSLKNYPYFYL